MTLSSGNRGQIARCRLASAVLVIFSWSTNAHAATRGLSDADIIYLGYVFVVVPIYVILMLAALFTRFLAKSALAQSVSRNIRSCANLLPVAMVLAFLTFKCIANPLLPGSYSDIGFYVTWGCILLPIPLVLIANFIVSRQPQIHRITSNLWGIGLYGAVTAAALLTDFLK